MFVDGDFLWCGLMMEHAHVLTDLRLHLLYLRHLGPGKHSEILCFSKLRLRPLNPKHLLTIATWDHLNLVSCPIHVLYLEFLSGLFPYFSSVPFAFLIKYHFWVLLDPLSLHPAAWGRYAITYIGEVNPWLVWAQVIGVVGLITVLERRLSLLTG